MVHTLNRDVKLQSDQAEAQIREKRKSVDYNTLEYPIDIIVQRYIEGEDEDKNEIFIPDYQREMVWDEQHQSKFIESIFLGLPIPYIFVADVSSELESEDLSRLEVIDGTQRIRALANFIKDDLELIDLKKLSHLNGLRFSDLPSSRQTRFKRTPLRMIQLTEEADEEVRRDLFERINSGSVELNEMEKRRGGQPGDFLNLLEELSQDKQFLGLCQFSKVQQDRKDPQEYVLRFFAFLHNYQHYSGKVHEFLDDFLIENNEQLKALKQKSDKDFLDKIQSFKDEFYSMLNFVDKYCPGIFITGVKKSRPVTRSKFESISVGIAMALNERSHLVCDKFDFVHTDKFNFLTNKNSSSSKQKVINRIQYVKDSLLSQ
jgi:uncharacterized protein with ParB-like and HNH nuclease domain